MLISVDSSQLPSIVTAVYLQWNVEMEHSDDSAVIMFKQGRWSGMLIRYNGNLEDWVDERLLSTEETHALVVKYRLGVIIGGEFYQLSPPDCKI